MCVYIGYIQHKYRIQHYIPLAITRGIKAPIKTHIDPFFFFFGTRLFLVSVNQILPLLRNTSLNFRARLKYPARRKIIEIGVAAPLRLIMCMLKIPRNLLKPLFICKYKKKRKIIVSVKMV